jgi:two-component system, response regulator PdtaR
MVVLIVEDELLIGMALAVVLRLADHEVHGPARSAERALELARRHRPEVALVEVALAGIDEGLDLARALRDRHGTATVFLTTQPERAREARDAALGVIAKPYDMPAVLRAVDLAADARAGRAIGRAPPGLELFSP